MNLISVKITRANQELGKAKDRERTQQIIQVDVKDQYKVDLTLSQHCLLC